eukprot:GHVH01005066.1.p1 GENE.GHVH01005066.1~~GHVH01005066.1.p1  ORF type:complete len:1425 (+),score=283.61 GHVH01005066.1:106-4380(+)
MAPKTIEDRYKKLTQIEHVLKRPDTYVGALGLESSQQWVWDGIAQRMVYRNITYSPGLFKIFDEILVNAADVKAREDNEKGPVSQKATSIKIDISQVDGSVRVWNDGDGIPVEIHKVHKIYVPELIFGHLLTSDNYDDTEARVTGGRNGYGAKLTNILSKKFTVECGDTRRERRIKITWENNMGKKSEPVVQPYEAKNFCQITFIPDFKRFGIEGFTDDIISLFHKRVFDIAGTTGVKVWLNGKDVKIRKFIDYCNLYFPPLPSNSSSTSAANGDDYDEDSNPSKKSKDPFVDPATGLEVVKIHEKVGRWEIVVAQSESGSMQQVSFVNNICTIKGGSHVKYITDQLLEPIMKKVNLMNKGGMAATANMALSHVWVFVNCLLVNPVFEGQTKERLKSDPRTFGSIFKVSDKVIKSLLSSPILEAILLWVQTKQAVDVTRKMNASAKRSSRITGIPKLEDANEAGGRNARHCTLIVTEGDSAKTSCVAGLSVVGRDRYGVFPLRGKLLNVREAKHEVLVNNLEVKNIMEIIGLRMGAKHQTVHELRYGKLMIMTDQDPDGSHIKGLIINLLQVFWPDLIKSNQFLFEFVTPIVKCSKGRENVAFFTNTEYRMWKRENNDGRGWKIKYYKGLGTSTDNEFKAYFSQLDLHTCKFKYVDEVDFQEVDKAFNSKLADERKKWISESNIDTDWIDHATTDVLYRDFINKDLVHFSRYDVERSIACVADGCKPGMRKCIYASIKKKIFKNEIKITQLCGNVLEVAAYHHGEAALQETIIKLAQRFVGANNIALFEPVGQFGSRKEGGKDCSAPRYINTRLSYLSKFILHENDEPILDIQMEDGYSIEPAYYVPVIPMVLVNGSEGIGTGWSSQVPQYNPSDLISACRKWIKKEAFDPLTPWYRGFKGEVRARERGFESVGIIEVKKEPSVEEPWAVVVVTELPVKFWTQSFKDLLESMMADNQPLPNGAVEAVATPKAKSKARAKGKAKGKAKAKATIAGVVRQRSKEIVIQDYRDSSSHVDVHFEIVLDSANYYRALELGLAKEFKLIRPIATSNMVLFDRDGHIKKYETELDIIRDFCEIRYDFYIRRKKFKLARLERELEIISNKSRFVKSVCDGDLVVARKKKSVLVGELSERGFIPSSTIESNFSKKLKLINAQNAQKVEEQILEEAENASEEAEVDAGNADYDYLLSMAIHSLTLEKYDSLNRDVDAKRDELQVVLKTTEAHLWDNDLTSIEEAIEHQEKLDEKELSEMSKWHPKRTSIKLSTNSMKKIRATPSKLANKGPKDNKKAVSSNPKPPKKKASSVDVASDDSTEFDSLDSVPELIDSPVRAKMTKAPPNASVGSPQRVMTLSERLAQRRAEKPVGASVVAESFNIDDVFAKLEASSPGSDLSAGLFQPSTNQVQGSLLKAPLNGKRVTTTRSRPPVG